MSVSVVINPFRFVAAAPERAFPVTAAVATYAAESATTHPVNVPAVTAGDLQLIIVNAAASTSYTISTPSGWTQLYNSANGNLRGAAFYREAPSTSGATTVNITISAGQRLTAVAYTITGHDTVPALADIISVSAGATGTSTTPNPSSVSVSWHDTGEKTLALAVAHSAAGASVSYPSGYSDGQTAYTGVFNYFHARTSVAEKNIEAASEDPGSFTLGDSQLWMARTIVIRGGVA